MNKLQELESTGRGTKLTLVSGREIFVRETNGNDESVFTNLKYALAGENIFRYLGEIVLKDLTHDKMYTWEQIKSEWPINDVYDAMLKHRIWQDGTEMTFTHKCSKCGNTQSMVEDLGIYVYNHEDKSKNIDGITIPPYVVDENVKDNVVTIQTSIGPLEFNRIVGKEEKELSVESVEDQSQIDALLPLRQRKLRKKLPNENLKENKLVVFQEFSEIGRKDMRKIRKAMKQYDPQAIPLTECKCGKCNHTEEILVIAMPDFLMIEE